MSSFLTKTKVAAGSVPNASTGKVNEFVDSADGYTKSKDESGNIEIYSGTVAVAAHEAASDPHPQYATDTDLTSGLATKANTSHTHTLSNLTQSGATIGQSPQWNGSSWVPVALPTDHGALTGLADDDHPQYHNDSRGDARYYLKAQTDNLLNAKSNLVGGNTFSGDQVINGGLSVSSTNRGFLPPRMTTAQRLAIVSPQNGLVIYDTDSDALFVYQADNSNSWYRQTSSKKISSPIDSAIAGTETAIGDFRFRYSLNATNGYLQIISNSGAARVINWSAITRLGGGLSAGGARISVPNATWTTLQPDILGNNYYHFYTILDVSTGQMYFINLWNDANTTIYMSLRME